MVTDWIALLQRESVRDERVDEAARVAAGETLARFAAGRRLLRFVAKRAKERVKAEALTVRSQSISWRSPSHGGRIQWLPSP